jgi:hypothetical protein
MKVNLSHDDWNSLGPIALKFRAIKILFGKFGNATGCFGEWWHTADGHVNLFVLLVNEYS